MAKVSKTVHRREVAVFTDLNRTSFSFAWELGYRSPERGKIAERLFPRDPDRDRVAFRLKALSARLERDCTPDSPLSPDLQKARSTAYDALIEPVRSFLDDVTTGGPGVNGRPFLTLASGAPPNHASRRVWLRRQDQWGYEFEGITTALHVPPDQRAIELRICDSFCAFDSGRIFYLLTLTQPAKPLKEDHAPQDVALDEYALLQLQQMALTPESDACEVACGGFSWTRRGAQMSLLELAEQRLTRLEAQSQPTPANAIRDILRPYGLAGPGLIRRPLTGDDLRRLCIGVESNDLLAVAKHAIEQLAETKSPGIDPARELEWATRVNELDATWKGACKKAGPGHPLHISPDGEDYPRPLLTFAGMAQGVPDFPAQDESEVHDSTRPTAQSVESTLFTHPRFMMEVAKSWRSYQRGWPSLGTCPYLLMTFLVAVHDELVVAELESRIEEMVHAAPRQLTPLRWLRSRLAALHRGASGLLGAVPGAFAGSRSRPMADVRDVLDRADQMFLSNVGILESNIRRRLELFRWASIHRSGNIFRYPKETAALAAVRKASGTQTRFADAHEMIDRIESLVEDVSNLRSSYAERRTNAILFVLAALGVAQLPVNIVDSEDKQGELYQLYREYLVDPFPINGPVPLGGPILRQSPGSAPAQDQDKRPSKSP